LPIRTGWSFSRWFDDWPVHGVASVGADAGGPG
jgi:hypothetical protein